MDGFYLKAEALSARFLKRRSAAPGLKLRCVSVMKPQRVEAAKVFKPSNPKYSGDRKQWVAGIRKALYASKISSCTQGYMLMRAAVERV